MGNKTLVIRLLFIIVSFLLLTKTYGQASDTIVIYDHVIVYDTIKVYDQETVYDTTRSENFFSKNNPVTNSILTIDTATQKAELLLFNKNDTATISINSILLSENTKNLETMKKKILTLAAVSAVLSHAASAQESTTKTEDVFPFHTVSIGGTLATNTDDWATVYGSNLKVDKVLNKKILVGLSADVGNVYKRGYNTGSNVGSAQVDNKHGEYVNVFATTTYYFLGSAAKNKIAGAYGKFGLGFVSYRTRQSSTFVGDPAVWTSEFTSSSFSAQLCVGSHVKLGKGKLFAEVVSIPALFTKIKHKTIVTDSSPIDSSMHWKANENITNNGFSQQLGFRLGYAISF